MCFSVNFAFFRAAYLQNRSWWVLNIIDFRSVISFYFKKVPLPFMMFRVSFTCQWKSFFSKIIFSWAYNSNEVCKKVNKQINNVWKMTKNENNKYIKVIKELNMSELSESRSSCPITFHSMIYTLFYNCKINKKHLW